MTNQKKKENRFYIFIRHIKNKLLLFYDKLAFISIALKHIKNKLYIFCGYLINKIFPVLIGIILALMLRHYYERNKKSALKNTYVASLISDLRQDSTLLDKNCKKLTKTQKTIKDILDRIYDSSANFDTIIKIARLEYETGFASVNEYNTNTLDALISTGNLQLFEKDTLITLRITELRRLQSNEQLSFNANRTNYFERLNKYSENYPYKSYYFFNKKNLGLSPIDSIMWEGIDESNFMPKFTNLVLSKRWGINKNLQLTIKNMNKTDSLLILLNDLNKQ